MTQINLPLFWRAEGLLEKAMLDLNTIIWFLGAATALGLAPGPDNIFVLTQSAISGRMAGFVVTLGLCTGLIVHTLAVALGVAAVFAASTTAFTVLKYIGAAYLLYLAWKAIGAGRAAINEGDSPTLSLKQLYGRGFIMNITNPKVAIFFLAFLPQFIAPERGPVALQVILLGLLFILTTIVVFGSIAWGAGYLGEWLRGSTRAQAVLNWAAALVFTGLALKLLTSER